MARQRSYRLNGQNYGDFFNGEGWETDIKSPLEDSIFGGDNPYSDSPSDAAADVAGGAASSAIVGAGGPVAMAAYAGLQIWSGIQQAELIQANAALQQRISEMNIKSLQYDMFQAQAHGAEQEAAYSTEVQQTIGDQRVALAANGVDLSSQGARAITEETRFTGFMNQLQIRQATRRRVLGLHNQAANMKLQADLNKYQAQAQASAAIGGGVIRAAGVGVSGYARK